MENTVGWWAAVPGQGPWLCCEGTVWLSRQLPELAVAWTWTGRRGQQGGHCSGGR